MKTWEYQIKDLEGLHARPASKLVMAARKWQSSIQISCNDNRADAKDILSVMALGARMGDHIVVDIDGDDQEKALESVIMVLTEYGGLNL